MCPSLPYWVIDSGLEPILHLVNYEVRDLELGHAPIRVVPYQTFPALIEPDVVDHQIHEAPVNIRTLDLDLAGKPEDLSLGVLNKDVLGEAFGPHSS